MLIWPLGLLALYFMDPAGNGPSLCPLKWMGISWCPGCGLGHAIHYLLHGQWAASWQAHPLGAFALGVLLYRILQLARQQIQLFHVK
ncbi:hypothetical protein GCM10009415_10010 [Chitinophaga japonensis]